MNKAKRLGVLALAGLVILSALASTSIAYGATTYYVRGPSGEFTEREADINMTYTPAMQPWNFSEGAGTSQGWSLNRGYSMMDGVRDYMNHSTYGGPSQYTGYRLFTPRNATGHNVTEPPDAFGWDNSGYGMLDNVRFYLNSSASENNLLDFGGDWRIFT